MTRHKPHHKIILAWMVIIASMTLSCNLMARLPESTRSGTTLEVPSTTEQASPAEPTPTATLPPTPTPIPAQRIESGDQALQDGDWGKAESEYQIAIQSSQDVEIDQAALLGIGRAQLAADKPQQAIESLEQLVQNKISPSLAPQVYFYLAQAYHNAKRYTEAADNYLNYMAQRPGVIDAYVLNLRGDALQANGSYTEAVNDYRAALQSPSFLSSTELQIKIARTHALAGDYTTAIALYDEIYNATNNEYTKAQMDFNKGQAYTALGEMDAAYAAYLDAVKNFPTSYDTYQGLIVLVDAGIEVNELERGMVDYYAGQYGVALAAFDRHIQTSNTDIAKTRYYSGLTQQDLGNYELAIDEWNKIIKNFPDDSYWDDAWEQKAYTQWWYLDQYPEAVKTLLDFVSSAPGHSRAGEFLYDAAAVAERYGNLEQAAKLWERVAREYPGYEKASRSLFLAGISSYRTGNYENAFTFFRSFLANASTTQDAAASYFWQAKTQKAMGDTQGAQASWELASAADPSGYYSERARDILRGLEPFTPPEGYDLSMDLATERLQAESWIKTTFALPEGTDLANTSALDSDPRYQRGQELWQLGLLEEARTEFEDLRISIQNDPVGNYQLMNRLYELGLYRSAILCARQVLNLAGMDDSTSLSAPVYFNHIRFGPYYASIILPIAKQYKLHPLFLMSLVRQESAFEGFVRSSAGARGLMQIIPATGEEISKSLGWPPGYSAEDLYRPLVSLTLGSEYLASWRDRLGGDLYATLAAYNAGPGNATEWQELAKGDPDLFLEVVRFEETRNYIRGVYELFTIYRRLYDRTP